MKKVIIFYASYGGGHLSAAKAINTYLASNYPDCNVQMIDCMKYINKAIDKLTTTAYKELAKKAPWAWGHVYKKSEKGLVSKISSDICKIMAIKMLKLFREEKPDIVISTHPFSSQMVSYLKKKNKITCKLATIMTDFAPHDQWLVGEEYVDYFFVSNETMKQSIVEDYHVNSKKIFVTGIPISNRFLNEYNKQEICEEFNLSSNKKTILFFGGGEYGLGKDKTVEILNVLATANHPIQVIAIAGKNQKLKEDFEQIVQETNTSDSIKVLSFTDKVPELMFISDLVITKPGGLTTSESLASSLPMIVINPIPGQEEENANFLETHGAAIWLKKHDDPREIINKLLTDDNQLKEMEKKASLLSRKNSTADICKICINGKEN